MFDTPSHIQALCLHFLLAEHMALAPLLGEYPVWQKSVHALWYLWPSVQRTCVPWTGRAGLPHWTSGQQMLPRQPILIVHDI